MLMMRVTPKMSDKPAPTKNRLDAAASPLSAWNRRASRVMGGAPARAANPVCSLLCGQGSRAQDRLHGFAIYEPIPLRDPIMCFALIRWIPGLVSLAQKGSLHSPGIRGVHVPDERALASEAPGQGYATTGLNS